MISVTRRYQFSASHRLHIPDLSEVENEQLYGKCNNPFGHGHDYALDVTVQGTIDPSTGQLILRHELDRLVHEQVLDVFEHRNINLDLRQFGSLVPTTENIALVIMELLQQHWSVYIPGSAHLSGIHIQETDRNGFEVLNRKSELAGIHG